ncbi:5'/3'-nucleotidase SurE [Halorhabdus rudnickae]|uniref:5'/3'-nucleotidase SurE n=1 Tax=Halorhabdus rudnickae TaxID=1775544 RepID=UPI001083BAD5|nr:5'/3'-nucleotidase SurE [Halorhabdus rudnickae]
MDEEPRILLTNDDGIDSVGLGALYEALSAVGEVTAVAPADDRSAVGRSISTNVEVSEHELGYAIDGTPADCVVAGLEVLVPETDIVVAGCNDGANLGAYVLGRSGTVSAAVEATFFDVPAIAVSMYVPVRDDEKWEPLTEDPASYANATRVARYLVEHAPDAGVFEQADYLNVNAPLAENGVATAPVEITEPSDVYEMGAIREGEEIELHDRIWEWMADGTIPDPDGTDRRAVFEGRVSVSPLTAPHTTEHHETLDVLADKYETE